MSKTERTIILQALGAVAVIGFAFYAAKAATSSELVLSMVQRYGYAGTFAISFIDGFNFLIPVVSASFIPLFIESGLSFWTVVVIMSVGMTCSNLIVFSLAKAGKGFAADMPLVKGLLSRLATLKNRGMQPMLLVFLYACFAPLSNNFILVPAAFMGYTAEELVLPVLAGNLVFNILFAKGILSVFH